MMGKILLRKLDTNCRNYFTVYLTNQKELQYHKEINYSLALSYLTEDNLGEFERYKEISEDKGNEISERDREAVCDYDRDFIPNIYIARAKLLILGGYYDNAQKLETASGGINITGNLALDKRLAASLIAAVPPAGLSNSIIDGNSISITCVQKSLGTFI